MSVDSFLKYSKIKRNAQKILKERTGRSYALLGTNTNKESSNVIIGTVSIKQLKAITKEKNVTITAFLTAVLIYSIYNENYKYTRSKDPISICIPVNLRKYFPSYSMNNFFSTIMVNIRPAKKSYSFEEILDIVSNKMKSELNESVLLEKFKYFVSLQQNIILRFIPLVLKDLLLRGISDIISEHGSTTTLSNLGSISVNDDVREYIDKVDMITYTDAKLPMKIGLCSFGDKLSISFSKNIADTGIERGFFTYLVSEGIDVRITASVNDSDIGDNENEIL